MKQDINKDFDQEIRSMLDNAEESVPSHIMDDVFSRLDEAAGKKDRKAAVIPSWLRWATTGVAAAAIVMLCIFIWPDKAANEEFGRVENTTAESCPVKVNNDEQTENHLLAEAYMPLHTPIARTPDTEASPETSDKTMTHYIETETGGSHDTDAASGSETLPEKSADDANEEYTEGESDPFADMEDDESRKHHKVSLILGGDVTSNGNASGLSRSGGFRVPPAALQDATIIEQTSKNSSYYVPVSFGLSTRVGLGKRWAIGAGVNWSMLQRTFSGTYTRIRNGKTEKSISSDIRHTIHYIGIPVNAYYDILQGSRVRLYAYAGGTVEKGLKDIYRVKDSPEDIIHKKNVKGVQLSAGAGLGVEFRIVDELGIYINPGVRYYFDCNQPVSIRTQQPFMMDFEIGLRLGI